MLDGTLTSRLPSWAVIRDARRRQRRRLQRRILLLVSIAAVGVGLFGRPAASGPPRASLSVTRVMSIEVGGSVLQVGARNGRIWVLTCVSHCGGAPSGADVEQLAEIDPSSGATTREFAVGDASAFALTSSGIWVAHFITGDVTRLEPASGRITATVPLRLPAPIVRHDRSFLPESLSAAEGRLWVSTARGWLAEIDARGVVWAIATAYTRTRRGTAIVLVIDPRTDRVLRRVTVPEADGAVIARGALYVGALDRGRIYRLDRHGTLRTYDTRRRRDASLMSSSRGLLWAGTSTSPGFLLSLRLPAVGDQSSSPVS
jgi:hypothetical protein